jgi:ribonuclease III
VTGSPGDGSTAAPDASRPGSAELLHAIGAPLGPQLLERALTHRSFAYENGGLPTNERLEFLGDSVLGLVVTDTLFREYPDLPEGQLAKLRAAVVNMRALAGVARGLQLGSYIRLGKGEEGTGGRDKSSILADTLEAVLGAVYLECGLAEADALVHRLFDPVIARSARLGAGLDWKTSLQELTAAELLGVPEYHVDESGPDHQKSFRASVLIGGRVYGEGEGRSKKEAEQQAAEAAWTLITAEISAADGGGDAADGSGQDSTAGGGPDTTAEGGPDGTAEGGPDGTAEGGQDSAAEDDPDSAAGGDSDGTAGGGPDGAVGGAQGSMTGGGPKGTAGGEPERAAGGGPASIVTGGGTAAARSVTGGGAGGLRAGIAEAGGPGTEAGGHAGDGRGPQRRS